MRIFNQSLQGAGEETLPFEVNLNLFPLAITVVLKCLPLKNHQQSGFPYSHTNSQMLGTKAHFDMLKF